MKRVTKLRLYSKKISFYKVLICYYIGQFKSGKWNGKGKMYDEKGKLICEGDYVDGLDEGNGKSFNEKDNYYIG